ncbi:hypothetical protein [Aestuariicoccus sp. MJ-SS9]|uniref:hypothetical protein n=1 Tax=Aestuariicoccus sp. MJ-SS9 TaxID=3079855 RepID=UPI00290D8D98|nr:hypothetical protein [Aestuariicoccus sp. MJ-SS9]MDU8913213.1 hypothetical protein [Aestuariicoccus sp. MJ-SS9]
MTLDGKAIDVGRVKNPMYILATKEDHIAPWRSVYPSTSLFGGDVTFVLGESGHIAGIVNPPRERVKYGYYTAKDHFDEPDAWLEAADYTKASWWSHWSNWLDAQGGSDQVRARKPGDGKLSTLEDAPGSFIRAS